MDKRRSVQGAHDRLLAAANALFVQHNINNVGIATILRESGCTRSCLYRHFGSKDGLAKAFLERRRSQVRHWVLTWVQGQSTVSEDRLLALFDILHEITIDPRIGGSVLLREIVQKDIGNPLFDEVKLNLIILRAKLRESLTDGMFANPDLLVESAYILLSGTYVAVKQGKPDAFPIAKHTFEKICAHWPRR